MTSVVNINDVLEGHVGLDIDVHRPALPQRLRPEPPGGRPGGALLRATISATRSPRRPCIEKIGNRFRREVKAFAEEHDIPILHLKKPDRTRWDDRKLDHVRPYLEAAEREGRFGVVAIVAAQEFQWVFSATKKTGGSRRRRGSTGTRPSAGSGCYYFYILDREFGPGFIKICTYFPYPAKVWLNGHEWAKRQARRGRLAFSELANGFAACDQARAPPGHLRPLRTRRRPGVLRPLDQPSSRPLHRGGPGRRLLGGSSPCARSRCRAPWSSTIPAGPGGFFEALVADNVGIGRPEEVAVVFARQVRKTTKEPFRDPGLLAGHRGEDGLSLQAQPGQAVLEGREGLSHRDRHQQARRTSAFSPGSSTCPSWSTRPGRSTIGCL